MIFVTVGTHEQPFNRLVEYIDDLVKNKIINDNIFIQTGYSTYEPKFCNWSQFLPYSEMNEKIKEADIVITHGGPSSFIMPLQVGKVPIVVPRQKQFDEHVNDHQLEFANAVAKRYKNIIVVENIDNLKDIILNYHDIAKSMINGITSNNAKFNDELEKIVKNIFKSEKKI